MTDDNLKIVPLTGTEIAAELRKRADNIARGHHLREMMVAAYALVAHDLDARERRRTRT
jgi:hypothetical protein